MTPFYFVVKLSLFTLEKSSVRRYVQPAAGSAEELQAAATHMYIRDMIETQQTMGDWPGVDTEEPRHHLLYKYIVLHGAVWP